MAPYPHRAKPTPASPPASAILIELRERDGAPPYPEAVADDDVAGEERDERRCNNRCREDEKST